MYQIMHLFLPAPFAIRKATGLPSPGILENQESCLKEHNFCVHSSDKISSITLWFVSRLLLLEIRSKACSDILTATKSLSITSNPCYIPKNTRKLAQASRSRLPRPLQSQATTAHPPSTVPSPAMGEIHLAPLLASLALNTMGTLRIAADAADSASTLTVTHITSLVSGVCSGRRNSYSVIILKTRIVRFYVDAKIHRQL